MLDKPLSPFVPSESLIVDHKSGNFYTLAFNSGNFATYLHLWYDKSGESARNNRNVNISKLWAVLEEIGGVEIITENLFWKINLEDHIFCDYIEIFRNFCIYILYRINNKLITYYVAIYPLLIGLLID